MAEMIESALYLQVPLDKLVEMKQHNTIHCEDPPLQGQDFGEGVGHSVLIDQSSFSMSSLISFKLADTNFFDSHCLW